VGNIELKPKGHSKATLHGALVLFGKPSTDKEGQILKGHRGGVTSVAFSPDGTRVASGSINNLVRIWNVVKGEVEYILQGHSHVMRSVAFSPDGTRVVSGSYDHSIWIWNLTIGKIEHILKSHSTWFTSVAFSPDGTRVVSGARDGSVQISNPNTVGSRSLSQYESCQLPDGSKVHHILPGQFHIFSRKEQEIFVFPDRNWLLTDPPIGACWIPPEFRDFLDHALVIVQV
jgi:WD40 repeat protein